MSENTIDDTADRRLAPVTSSAFFETGPRDWPWGEGDNDNYQNRCASCNELFRGHKRQPTCRKCAEEWKAKWESMTPDEQKSHMEKVNAIIAAHFSQNDQVELPPKDGSESNSGAVGG